MNISFQNIKNFISKFFKTMNSQCLPNSGTEVTLGAIERALDFSNEDADLEKRFCPDSSTMLGRTLVEPPAVLGPQVFPFTPSAGTIIRINTISIQKTIIGVENICRLVDIN